MTAQRLRAAIDGEYPRATIATVRTIVGCLAALRAAGAWRVLQPLTRDAHLKAPWHDWLPSPSMPTIAVMVCVWLLTAVLFAIGIRTRMSGPALVLAILATSSLDQQAYSNHLYLMVIMVALLALASPTTGRAPAWPVTVLKLQITVVYLFAAFTKLNQSWLSGQILRRFIGAGLIDPPGLLLSGPWLAVLVVAVELVIAVGLWSNSLRRPAITLGVLMHLAIPLTMSATLQLSVFSGLMVASYVLFATPAVLRQRVPEVSAATATAS